MSTITITVCGAPESGKTALIRRYLDNEFSDDKKENYTRNVCFYFLYYLFFFI